MRLRRQLCCGFLTILVWTVTASAADRELQTGSMLILRVMTLLDARLALMPEVAASKWVAHQPVSDPAREATVIRAVGAQAVSRGLAREPVEALLSEQIARAREVQTEIIANWQEKQTGPQTAPSLQDTLRPAIDRLTAELLDTLTLAAPFLASADLSAAAATLPDLRWRASDRLALVNALRAVHFDLLRSPQRLRNTGILRIGVPGDYAPFAWISDGHLTGADIALTEALAGSLGLRPVYIQSSWSTLLDDLEADHFDIAAGGISINDHRRARAGFSHPLVTGGKTALGRCADRDRFHSVEAIDQPSTRVIENPGGTNEAFARHHLQRAQLRIYPDNLGIFAEIAAGRADVMYTDDIEIARVIRREPTLCQLFREVFEPAQKALLLPAGEDWTALINTPLVPITASGRYTHWLEDATSQ